MTVPGSQLLSLHSICLVVLAILLSQATSAIDCPDGKCCSGSLREFEAADDETLTIYGDKLVYLTSEAQDTPSGDDYCRLIDNFVVEGSTEASTGLLFDQCTTYCQEKDVTIMVGAAERGLNLPRAVDVCFEPAEPMTAEDEQACANGNDALFAIEEATAIVVANLAQVQLAGLSAKTELTDLTKQARDRVLSPEYRTTVENSRLADLPDTIISFYNETVKAFGAVPEFVGSLSSLKTAFDGLEETFEKNFQAFIDTLENCNKMIPRTAADNTIVYNMCAVSRPSCFEEADGNHVSCCCSYNPISTLPGLHTSKPNEIDESTFFDICSESRRDVREWSTVNNVQSAISNSVYQQYVDKLKAAHGDFYRPPDFEPSTEGQASTRGVAAPFPAHGVTGCDAEKIIRDLEPDQLPESLLQTGNEYRNLKIISDFSGDVKDNYCNDKYPNAADAFARCEDFCGSMAVPLLMGTPTNPVALSQILPVCFSDSVVTDHETAEFCSSDGGEALQNLQTQVSAFVGDLVIFRLSKILFVTAINEGAEAVKVAAESEEFRDAVQQQGSLDAVRDTYIDFYKQHFAVLSEAEEDLVAIGNRVKDNFAALKTLFDSELSKLQRFAEECNSLRPRFAGEQAVLAICPAYGEFCPYEEAAGENEPGSYVYCCCAENSNLAVSEAYDVCSASKGGVAGEYEALVNTVVSKSRRSAQDAYYFSYLDGMWERYGDDYDPPVEDSRRVVKFVAEAARFSVTLERVALTGEPYDNEFLIGGEDDISIELDCGGDDKIKFRSTFSKDQSHDATGEETVIACDRGKDLRFKLVEDDVFSDDEMDVTITPLQYGLLPLASTTHQFVKVEGFSQVCISDLSVLGAAAGSVAAPCATCPDDIDVRTITAPASQASDDALRQLGLMPAQSSTADYAVFVCQGGGGGIYRLDLRFDQLPEPETSGSPRSRRGCSVTAFVVATLGLAAARFVSLSS